ncbi:hypothetical protein, partial [Actinoplanes solisilvae]|uniref:hypothetical protein n=1 Tax=Actinoplanes solisilvae TaxID=2486853 RepID=UPI00196B430A
MLPKESPTKLDPAKRGKPAGVLLIGTGLSSTLLSSQRTTAPGLLLRGTRSTLLGLSRPVKSALLAGNVETELLEPTEIYTSYC